MIAIVDACSGNLRSVERALERAGGRAVVSRDPDVVRRADKIVVPGQGAFGVFMRGLIERGLGGALREAIASGRPYLGICLGMQVLLDGSEEATEPGLGLIPGRVARLRPPVRTLKVPHMGWNQVRPAHPDRALHDDPMLAGVPADAYVYFVHSYHALPVDRRIVTLVADHGEPLTAALRVGNVFACQFHPEKSQAVGQQILRNFVAAA
jgi:glutamine amidotransferase